MPSGSIISKLLISAVFVLFLSANVFSATDDSLLAKKYVISTSVFEYIPIVFHNSINYNLESEFYRKNRHSLIINLGYIHSRKKALKDFYLLGDMTDPSHGFRLQFEARKYLNLHKMFEPACLVFWPHMFQSRSEKLQNSGYYTSMHSSFRYVFFGVNTPFRRDDYNRRRKSWSNAVLNLKFGYRCIRKSGYSIDYGVGTGIQYVIDNSYSIYSGPSWGGGYLFPSLVYQMKIGWGFRDIK